MSSAVPKPGESLAELRPDLAAEWDTEKNGIMITPWDVKLGSQKKVWWQCSKCGNEWTAMIYTRSHGSGCPECASKSTGVKISKPKQGESLVELRPDLAAEWDQEKNKGIEPKDIKVGSNRQIWWKCNQGHEWQASPNSRTNKTTGGSGCPICANKKVLVGYNDLATTHPQLAAEWHPTKNGNLQPTDVIAGSKRKVWWKCQRGHEWQTAPNSRTNEYSGGTGCPYCISSGTSYPEQYVYWALKQVYQDTYNRFKTTNRVEYDIYVPSIGLTIEYSATKWHEHKNDIDSYKRELALQSSKRFISIIEDKNCVSESFEDDVFIYNPHKNQDKVLRTIIGIILNYYGRSISEIDFGTVKNNAIEYSKGKIEYEKSLEYLYPDIAKEWHPTKNNGMMPKDVTPGSHKKVWWQCSKGHEWESTIVHRSIGRGCPYCAKGSSAVIIGENDLETTHPQLASEWHPTKNGSLKPTDVRAGSHKRIWWKCSKGHEWEAVISSRSSGKYGCPYCARHKNQELVKGADGKTYYI